MINAVPSSNNSSTGAGASPMPPVAVVPPQVLPSQGVNPHGVKPAVSSLETPFSTNNLGDVNTGETFSQDLKDKLNGAPASPISSVTTVSPVLPLTDTIPSTTGPTSFTPPPIKPKPRPPFKALLAVLVMGLVVAGAGAAYYMTNGKTASLDNRNKAASEEVTNTERFTSFDQWQDFNKKWVTFNSTKHTWQETVAYATGEGARYTCDKQILQVDKEVNYGCDLDAMFALMNNNAYIKAGPISPQDIELNAVLDHLITNSAILQTAAANNVLTLTPAIFNSPTKNMEARFDALTTARAAIGKDFVKTIDFEEITIYFQNEVDPAIPLEQAKAAGKAKMDVLYNRLKSGEITMAQAGKEIAADNIAGDTTGVSLAKLDPRKIYPENAYAKVTGHGFDDQIFTDPVYDDELKSLGEGQMSTVRTCKDYKFTLDEFIQSSANISKFPFVDSCFIIFKLNKINYGLSKDLEGTTQQQVEDKIKAAAKVTKLQ